MKNTKSSKIKLGIFVTISASIFMLGIYFIGQRQQLFSTTFNVNGIFKDISGLQVGNNVRFSGMNVGIVSDIHQITDTTVKVNMSINEHSRQFIKKNAKAIIGSDGLMGNKIVQIIPGITGLQAITNNDTIGTTQPVNIDDILLKVKETSDNAAEITQGLAVIIHNISKGRGTIGKLFVDTAFAKNLDATIVNIKQGAGGFKQNMDAASHNFFLRGFLKRKERREKERADKKASELANEKVKSKK